MKKMKQTVATMLTAVLTFSLLAGCNAAEKSETAIVSPTQGTTSGVPATNESVNDNVIGEAYDGQIVHAGGNYEFTNKIAFLSTELSAQSEGEISEALTISLTSTVTPSDAKQDVIWSVAFVNPDSEWASGKTVTDYVTVEPTEEYGNTATVTCLAAFSEQIKIVCTSRYASDKYAECLVDFVSEVTKVTLKLGEFAVNLGGQTDVEWELGAADGWGGDVSVAVESEKEGTLTDSYTWQVDLVSPEWYTKSSSEFVKYEGDAVAAHYSSAVDEGVPFWQYETYDEATLFGKPNRGSWGYFIGYGAKYLDLDTDGLSGEGSLSDGCLMINGYDCFMRRRYNVTTFSFDYTTYQDSYLGAADGTDSYGYFSNSYSETLLKDCYSSTTSGLTFANKLDDDLLTATITDGRLYTLVLTLTNNSTGESTPYLSLLNLTGFTSSATVTGVSLSKTQISVSENEIW